MIQTPAGLIIPKHLLTKVIKIDAQALGPPLAKMRFQFLRLFGKNCLCRVTAQPSHDQDVGQSWKDKTELQEGSKQ